MPQLRTKDWVRIATLLVLVGAVIIVEIASGKIRSFYVDHPLQAGVLTGVLLSVVAYFGFDAIRASLNEARWGPLSSVAFLSLAYQTTLVIDVLLWLATGIAPENDAEPTRARQRELETLRERARARRPSQNDLGKVEFGAYDEALQTLLAYPDWCRFARRELDRWKWHNRDGLARWAGAMLTTGEAAAVLNRLAALNESLSVLQSWLRTLIEANADRMSRRSCTTPAPLGWRCTPRPPACARTWSAPGGAFRRAGPISAVRSRPTTGRRCASAMRAAPPSARSGRHSSSRSCPYPLRRRRWRR